jgi:hypothetical protein
MSIKCAVWVHGSDVALAGTWPTEFDPRRDDSFGFAPANVQFMDTAGLGGKAILRFRPSTPVILDDRRLKIARFFVLFRTMEASLSYVMLHDNEQGEIANFPQKEEQTGEHGKGINETNTWELEHPTEVYGGLVLDLWVDFSPQHWTRGPTSDGRIFTKFVKSRYGSIQFIAAGFDLV